VSITYGGRTYPPGSIIITRADNHKKGNTWFRDLNSLSDDLKSEIVPISTGFAEAGPDLGSGQLDLFKKPKVLCVMGEDVSSNAYGQVKWYFDRVINYSMSSITTDKLNSVELSEYNTLILPHGNYSLESRTLGRLSEWVDDGGKLIAIDGATRAFTDKEGFGLKQYATDDEKSDTEKSNKQADLAARYNHFSDRERNYISNYVPGAIFELKVDQSHPLAFGLGGSYYSLRTSNTHYPLIVDANNVIYHPEDNGQVIGFAGNKIQKKLRDSVAFAVESKGAGKVIYMTDNPLFRGFWYNGQFLFGNALFQV